MGDLIPFPSVSTPARSGPDDRRRPSRPRTAAPEREKTATTTVVVDLPLRTLLGDVLREARRERGKRLADVAADAAISPQYLSEVERGIKDPSSEIVRAIGRALDLTTLDILERSADRLRPSSTGPVLLAA